MRLTSRLFSSVTTKSMFVGTIVVLAVGAFAFTGVGQFNPLDPNTAASVGNQQVTMRQLQEAMQQQRADNDDPAARRAQMQSTLDQLIQQKIFVEEAERLGWVTNDVEVADWIKKIPSFQNKDTKKFDMETYRKFLKSGQLSELELYRQGRESIGANKFYTLLALPDVVPVKLVEERQKRDREEFTVEFVEIAPKDEEVKKAAQAEAEAFAADAKNEAELAKAYESSKADFSRKAQVRVQSVLVAFKGATRAQGAALERPEAEARAMAEKALERARGGEDFGKVASEVNDDGNAKGAQGDIGWIDDTNIDPDTAKAAFALTSQAPLSGVLKTPFGYRVVRLTDSRPAIERKLADVKVELALRTIAPQTKQKLTSAIEQDVSAALSQKGAALDAAARKHGLAWKKIAKPVTVSSRFIEELGLADPLLKEVFALKTPGDVVGRILDFGGRRVAVRLVSRSQGAAPDPKDAALASRGETFRVSQAFVQGAQKSLFDTYQRDKQIKRNDAILRFE
jgi:hypothetical protein